VGGGDPLPDLTLAQPFQLCVGASAPGVGTQTVMLWGILFY